MKLNLLPQTVSKGRAVKTAWFFGGLIMAGSVVLTVLMTTSATAARKSADDDAVAQAQPAADAVTTAAAADTVIATAADVIRDADLSKAMIDHNDVYVKLYSDVNEYIPSFFRITSETATPVDATTSTVTLTGTLGSYQQYSDLILSLMRFKDAKTVSRSGYVYDPVMVPALSVDDPVGTPRKQDATPIPTDQLERLSYYQAQAHPQGYLQAGNFGDADPATTRGAMPGQSQVTIVLTVSRDLQAPDPQATLAAAGSASAGGTAAGGGFGGPGGMAASMGPGGPPGVMRGAGGPPGAVGGGRKASNASDD